MLKRNDGLRKDIELERLRMLIDQSIRTPWVRANGHGGIDRSARGRTRARERAAPGAGSARGDQAGRTQSEGSAGAAVQAEKIVIRLIVAIAMALAAALAQGQAGALAQGQAGARFSFATIPSSPRSRATSWNVSPSVSMWVRYRTCGPSLSMRPWTARPPYSAAIR